MQAFFNSCPPLEKITNEITHLRSLNFWSVKIRKWRSKYYKLSLVLFISETNYFVNSVYEHYNSTTLQFLVIILPRMFRKRKIRSNPLFSSFPVRFRNCLCVKNVHIVNNNKNSLYLLINFMKVYLISQYILTFIILFCNLNNNYLCT